MSDLLHEALQALKGIVDDDGPYVSLNDQRARNDARMRAAKAVLDKAGVAYEHYDEEPA